MYSLDDTIVAISTPLGEGGIGIVRMSGPDAAAILHHLFLPGSPSAGLSAPMSSVFPRLQPRCLHYGHIIEPGTGETVDEVLVTYMPEPRTYTRQDVVEINGHGGFVALQQVHALCLRHGARLAEPGEFTVRAFLNGRLDLAQAEAVLDVIQAKTETVLRSAVGQLAGQLSAQVRKTRTLLVNILAYLEATIDFDEDEIPEQDIGPGLDLVHTQLEMLLAEADRGIIYRQGIRAAIIGRPNVGKSSLLNRLLRTNRAIVTDIPGTTRDTLEETLNLQGIPVVLVDTAGMASSTDNPIERLGIERSRSALAQADLVLFVLDVSQPIAQEDREIAGLIQDKPAIVVLNKIDLLNEHAEDIPKLVNAPWFERTRTPVSALTGQGLEALESEIVTQVLSGQVITTHAPLVTNPRHRQALDRARDHVDAARCGHKVGRTTDLLAIDVASAVGALGEITGQTASQDLIEAIFSNFCVGK